MHKEFGEEAFRDSADAGAAVDGVGVVACDQASFDVGVGEEGLRADDVDARESGVVQSSQHRVQGWW